MAVHRGFLAVIKIKLDNNTGFCKY